MRCKNNTQSNNHTYTQSNTQTQSLVLLFFVCALLETLLYDFVVFLVYIFEVVWRAVAYALDSSNKKFLRHETKKESKPNHNGNNHKVRWKRRKKIERHISAEEKRSRLSIEGIKNQWKHAHKNRNQMNDRTIFAFDFFALLIFCGYFGESTYFLSSMGFYVFWHKKRYVWYAQSR